MSSSSIQRVVMRRVYYSFAVAMLCHPAFLIGAVFMVSTFAVKELVHVARVWDSFVSVPVGRVPEFMFHLVTHSEASTLLATAAMVVSFSLFVRLLLSYEFTSRARQHIPV